MLFMEDKQERVAGGFPLGKRAPGGRGQGGTSQTPEGSGLLTEGRNVLCFMIPFSFQDSHDANLLEPRGLLSNWALVMKTSEERVKEQQKAGQSQPEPSLCDSKDSSVRSAAGGFARERGLPGQNGGTSRTPEGGGLLGKESKCPLVHRQDSLAVQPYLSRQSSLGSLLASAESTVSEDSLLEEEEEEEETTLEPLPVASGSQDAEQKSQNVVPVEEATVESLVGKEDIPRRLQVKDTHLTAPSPWDSLAVQPPLSRRDSLEILLDSAENLLEVPHHRAPRRLEEDSFSSLSSENSLGSEEDFVMETLDQLLQETQDIVEDPDN
ncbi:uncharacterized protein LOC140702722 [Pogona vitticeps]